SHFHSFPLALTCRYEETEGNTAECDEFLPHPETGKKSTRFMDFEGKTSFGMSVFNLSNAIMGSGILGLAYAMANTGIILFLFLLTAVALLSTYSIHLLLKASGVVGIRAYEQLGYRAFGTPGKLAAALAITLQNIGAMSSYLYIVKYELPLVIQAFLNIPEKSGEWYLNGNYLVIMATVVVVLPLALMKQLGYLGYTSGFSLTCMVFFLIVVIYKKFEVPCMLPSTGNSSLPGEAEQEYTPSYEEYTHEVLPDQCVPHLFTVNSQVLGSTSRQARIHSSQIYLPKPSSKSMQHVSNISILFMYIMYFFAALFGYLTFYENVEPELLHTYNRIDPFNTLVLCVRVAVLIAVALTVPIVLFPVRRAIQQMLFPNKTFSWLRHIVIASILLAIINLLVIFAPNILDIFGIIGK
uniref:Solute carrier family 38 member 3b n=1 Tax=Callorhinchus milii TaxID=7868 RepID=A0A4W3JQG0_CALMI